MALRFEALVIGVFVLGSCLAGLTAQGEGAPISSASGHASGHAPVPVACSGAGCGTLGFSQGGKADLVMVDASSTNTAKPIAQSLVVQCVIRPDNSRLDSPCGQTTIAYRDLDTSKRQWLKFNGSTFTIPVHKDFGRFDLHVQPKRCSIGKDIHNVLVGGITTLTFRNCK